MKRAHALLAILIVLAAVGYGPIMTRIREARGLASGGGPTTCEYEGRTYRLEEQRRAADGCNVCTCGETGWACTKIACVPGGPGIGTVAGTLAYPSEVLPAQRVCALNVVDEKEYCLQTTEGESSYAIPVPEGEYQVYAALEDDATGKRAYFSEFVRCGLKAECKDHSPVTVLVKTGETAEAHPHDWYATAQIDGILVAPSRWEYSTHNYYPGSSFLVTSRGLASVEISFTPYPPVEGASYALIGAASLVKEERGIQTWSLAVPEGFQAMRVRAKGDAANGEFLMSRDLRIVRPIATASASSTVR